MRTACVPGSPESGVRRELKSPSYTGLLERAHLGHASFRCHEIRVFAIDFLEARLAFKYLGEQHYIR